MYINRTTNETLEWVDLKSIYKGKSIPKDGTITILDYSYVFGSAIPEYDEATQKLVELEPTLTDGKYYRAYEVVELTAEEVEVIATMKARQEVLAIEAAIDKLIQDEIDAYNNAQGTKYKNVDSLPKYERNESYTHYVFIVSCLDWVELIWEEARQSQINIRNGIIPKPETVEEFMVLLPRRVG